MRLAGRFIPREVILAAVASYELVEAYPDDKYFPSYLVLARHGPDAFHVLFAADVVGDNVRVATSHRPSQGSGSLISRQGGQVDEMRGVWS
jgi:hypothetical protein